MSSVLNPTQQRVVDELIAENAPRPIFDEKLRHNLTRALDDSLSDITIPGGDKQFWVSKNMLSQIHACEGHFVADHDNFAWSAATATGTVAHKAAELSANTRQDYPPAQLVDLALERLQQDDKSKSLGTWLQDAPELEIADLRGTAIDQVSKFLDTFPPLENAMRYRFESALRAEILDKSVVLHGRIDLGMFKSNGNQAGVLIIELKTGREHPAHLDDLRYYALLETLRSGVPPYRVATLYLDSGNFVPEDVTEDMLFTTIRRVSDGIRKIIEVQNSAREIELSPGSVCSFCSARPTCPRAEEGLRRDDD